jgi:hypothetical protein
MFGKICALLLALTLLLPGGGFASHRDLDIAATARWAGCTADLTTSDEVSIAGSAYSPDEHRLYIGTQPGAPEYVYTIVALHEIGHCLQWQEESPLRRHTPERELDADRRAADLACAMGLDGAQMLHDTMVWAKQEFDYNGDPNHGTLVERISASALAYSCRVVPQQA